MTPPEYIQELTRKHDDALERLDLQERKERRNFWAVLVSLVGALGAGGGGGIAYMQDLGDDDNVKTVVAVHVATDKQWKANADSDINTLLEQQQKLREAIIRLQATVEGLSARHRNSDQLRRELVEVERMLGDLGTGGASTTRKAAAPAPEMVQQLKTDLFEEQ